MSDRTAVPVSGSASGTYRRRLGRALPLALLLAVAVGCREVALGLGVSAGEARARADGLLLSLGSRFGPAESAPGFDETRRRFARNAFIPSRLYPDTTVWTAAEGSSRTLRYMGRRVGSSYVIGLREGVRSPTLPGEYRRSTRLERLAPDQYQWTIRDELAVGAITPGDLGTAYSRLLAAVEGRDPGAVRAAYEAAFPNTRAALGRLFSVDSIAVEPVTAGGSRLVLVARVEPRRLEPSFRDFSRYLDRYVRPTRFDVRVEDLEGTHWWRAELNENRLRLHLRVSGGRLAPLAGPPRQLPDSLRVRVDLATRISLFGIGASGLVGEVGVARGERDAGFIVRFQREPDWQLPPLVERLIRTPLRRPFAGEGASLGFSARSGSGSTLLVRDYRIAVQESAIMRWFGGLGNTLISDLRGSAEHEMERFLGEAFEAMRVDVAALLR